MAAELAQVAQIQPSYEIQEVVIEGKVTAVNAPRESEYMYYTLQTKASDEYSLPAVMQISQLANQRPFAKEADIVKIKAKVSGYPRKVNGNVYITNTLTFVAHA